MLNGIVALHGTGVPPVTNSYESIATVTVTSSVNSISFTGIPSTYKHLQVRAFIGTDNGSKSGLLQFNLDTGSNYSFHQLYGDGGSAGASAATSQTSIATIYPSSSTTSGNRMGAGIIDILDYASTNKYKTVRTLTGEDDNGSGNIFLRSGAWLSTSAITSLKLTVSPTGNWIQYSHFALYGIKG